VFWLKKFSLPVQNKIISSFMIFLATKNSRTKKNLPLLFGAVVGSGIWDPRSGMDKNQDLGSRINIPDPQHYIQQVSSQTVQQQARMPHTSGQNGECRPPFSTPGERISNDVTPTFELLEFLLRNSGGLRAGKLCISAL
jgi:hypothetical protein